MNGCHGHRCFKFVTMHVAFDPCSQSRLSAWARWAVDRGPACIEIHCYTDFIESTNTINTHYIHSVVVQYFVSGRTCCVNQNHYESLCDSDEL